MTRMIGTAGALVALLAALLVGGCVMSDVNLDGTLPAVTPLKEGWYAVDNTSANEGQELVRKRILVKLDGLDYIISSYSAQDGSLKKEELSPVRFYDAGNGLYIARMRVMIKSDRDYAYCFMSRLPNNSGVVFWDYAGKVGDVKNPELRALLAGQNAMEHHFVMNRNTGGNAEKLLAFLMTLQREKFPFRVYLWQYMPQ